jgi:hypothetical protein
VTDIRVPEDAVLGEVRRAGPHRFRRTVLAEDEKLVVHQLAVHTAAAQGLDVSRLDRIVVLLRRPHVVEEHVHLCAALMCLPDGRKRIRPLKLVEGAVYVPPGPGPCEEGLECLEETAGEPLVRAWTGDVRRLVLEAARVLLRCDGTAVEEG